MPVSGFFFSFTGRATRSEFWVGALFLLSVASITALLLVGLASTWLDPRLRDAAFYSTREGLRESWAIMLTVTVVIVWPLIAIIVKRLRDLGRPTWIAPVVLLPVLADFALDMSGFGAGQRAGSSYLVMAIYFSVIAWLFVDLGCWKGALVSGRHDAETVQVIASEDSTGDVWSFLTGPPRYQPSTPWSASAALLVGLAIFYGAELAGFAALASGLFVVGSNTSNAVGSVFADIVMQVVTIACVRLVAGTRGGNPKAVLRLGPAQGDGWAYIFTVIVIILIVANCAT